MIDIIIKKGIVWGCGIVIALLVMNQISAFMNPDVGGINPWERTPKAVLNRDLSGSSSTATTTTATTTTTTTATRYSSSEMAIIYMFLGLLIGIGARTVHKLIKIPEGVTILLIGMFVGGVFLDSGYIGDIATFAITISPHFLMSLFLPGLVFESAYNSDSFTLNRNKWQVLLMSGPGALCNA